MIDFPPGTTIGQIFNASNGVTYMWTGTIWVATGSSAGGDFYAMYTGAAVALPASATAAVFNSVINGNSGGWYNTSTGRFTPPAGRYSISTGFYIQEGTTAPSTALVSVRKNGVVVATSASTPYSVAGYGSATAVQMNADANGTDYFDVVTWQTASGLQYGNVANSAWFSAFPLSGIKGPQGDPGQIGFRLLQRTDVSGAVADVSIQGIASDINDLKFAFDLTPVTNAVSLGFQFYDNTGTLVTGVVYQWATTQAPTSAAGGTAPFVYSGSSSGIATMMLMNVPVAGSLVGNANGIRGSGTIHNIRAARFKSLDFQATYIDDAGSITRTMTGGGQRVAAGAITGFRLVFTSGNVAAGGAFSVWGSP